MCFDHAIRALGNRRNILNEAWNDIEIIVNSTINELCNQNRYSDAKDLKNCRDIVKTTLLMIK